MTQSTQATLTLRDLTRELHYNCPFNPSELTLPRIDSNPSKLFGLHQNPWTLDNKGYKILIMQSGTLVDSKPADIELVDSKCADIELFDGVYNYLLQKITEFKENTTFMEAMATFYNSRISSIEFYPEGYQGRDTKSYGLPPYLTSDTGPTGTDRLNERLPVLLQDYGRYLLLYELSTGEFVNSPEGQQFSTELARLRDQTQLVRCIAEIAQFLPYTVHQQTLLDLLNQWYEQFLCGYTAEITEFLIDLDDFFICSVDF
jgi:hypothetical protein